MMVSILFLTDLELKTAKFKVFERKHKEDELNDPEAVFGEALINK